MICSLALTCQFCTQAEHVYPVILANSASGWLMNMLYFGMVAAQLNSQSESYFYLHTCL